MHQFLPRLIVGFHGTLSSVADKLLGDEEFHISRGPGEWLGDGVYFWLNDPTRARSWANDKIRKMRERGELTSPNRETAVVLGAVIDPGNCLDLSTKEGLSWLKSGHDDLAQLMKAARRSMPKNKSAYSRPLDRAVIETTVHSIRKMIDEDIAHKLPPRVRQIDSVLAIFPDGNPVYRGALLGDKTHTQICVRDPKRIIGVFKVKERLFHPRRMDGLV